MSSVDSEEESPEKKKSFFGVCVGEDKYNHPSSYKGFSKDAGPLIGSPNNTNQTIFGSGVPIYCFEPSSTRRGKIVSERRKNVSKEVGHFSKKSVRNGFGTCVGIYRFKPSSIIKQGMILSKRRKNVSIEVGLKLRIVKSLIKPHKGKKQMAFGQKKNSTDG